LRPKPVATSEDGCDRAGGSFCAACCFYMLSVPQQALNLVLRRHRPTKNAIPLSPRAGDAEQGPSRPLPALNARQMASHTTRSPYNAVIAAVKLRGSQSAAADTAGLRALVRTSLCLLLDALSQTTDLHSMRYRACEGTWVVGGAGRSPPHSSWNPVPYARRYSGDRGADSASLNASIAYLLA
jgi:hypothetical protein